MKKYTLFLSLLFLIIACKSDKVSEQTTSTTGIHTVIVQEVLQTNQYTYLRVKEGDLESWLATPKMQAAAGETYYYKNGLAMTEFVSKELNRSFKEIMFLDYISSSPALPENTGTAETGGSQTATPDAGMENHAVEPTPIVNANALHKLIAEEILQTNQYTYLRGKEDGKELWIAVTRMDAKAGTTYYFKGGLPMTGFASKELKRTFDSILFVDNIATNPQALEANSNVVTQNNQAVSTGSSVPLEKKEVSLSHAKTDLTIATLLKNKSQYAEKSIKIKGEVTKFNTGIMKKNWIHIQDGTEFDGKFDLTITTDQEVKVGDKISVEGNVHLDKDFGFGYFYDVIVEDAKISK